ncbi:transposase [Kineosporia sp. NBRC 101731]|uniref:IS701 family transposase n=1 Tax=Kineosporia sp. NBRC 101731 TaxID=3032199 RepID=UPI0025549514|nr:transposase [Kineosporia sp. NBRC 101731]
MFSSLPRRDQRVKATNYVRGLLRARGRKSVRNIAQVLGPDASEQSLHHFVSESTWDWWPVRHALARRSTEHGLTSAWVLQPMVVEKAGTHTVGVTRRFDAASGRTMNLQSSYGVWAASPRGNIPVSWRLQLPEEWTGNQERRRQAAVPPEAATEGLEECAVRACLELAAHQGHPARPLVADARAMDVVALVRLLESAGRPFLVRVPDCTPVLAPAPFLSGQPVGAPSLRPAAIRPVELISATVRSLRRPVVWHDPAGPRQMRTSIVSTVPVRADPRDEPGNGPLHLVSTGSTLAPGPAEHWLTNLPSHVPGDLSRLLHLTGLLAQVAQDASTITERVGIRDYTGRSFGGWHRHMTLASVAHAVIMARRPSSPQARIRARV